MSTVGSSSGARVGEALTGHAARPEASPALPPAAGPTSVKAVVRTLLGIPDPDPIKAQSREELFNGIEKRMLIDEHEPWTMKQTLIHHMMRIYHPCEPVRMLWDKVLMVILLYSLMSIPVSVSLNVSAVPLTARWWFDLLVDVYFCVDIATQFSVGFIDEDGVFITDRCKIAWEYCKMWFWIDIGTSVPIVSLLEVVMTSPRVASFLRIPRMLRIVRILRLFKLLRLMKLAKLMSSWQNSHTDMGTAKRIGKLLAVVFFIAHTCACVWCFADIAAIGDDGKLPPNGWMARPENAVRARARVCVCVCEREDHTEVDFF